MLAHAMFGRPLLQLGTTLRTGPDQWLAETVATFGLVAIVLLARRPHALPLLIGGYIGAAYFFTASTSFANPAVTVARLLTDSFAGIRPLDAPGFILAQLAGALLALVACRWLVPAGPPTEERQNKRGAPRGDAPLLSAARGLCQTLVKHTLPVPALMMPSLDAAALLRSITRPPW